MAVNQLEAGTHKVENQYSRAVRLEGNLEAKKTINKVFEVSSREWRGIGAIPESGYGLRSEYRKFDAALKFNLQKTTTMVDSGCLAGDVLKGKIKPAECPHFGKECNPANPLGAPMVSSEGACAAYYHYTSNVIE